MLVWQGLKTLVLCVGLIQVEDSCSLCVAFVALIEDSQTCSLCAACVDLNEDSCCFLSFLTEDSCSLCVACVDLIEDSCFFLSCLSEDSCSLCVVCVSLNRCFFSLFLSEWGLLYAVYIDTIENNPENGIFLMDSLYLHPFKNNIDLPVVTLVCPWVNVTTGIKWSS